MTDAKKLVFIREKMPVTKNSVFLNTGTTGPLSTITIETLNEINNIELKESRAVIPGFVTLVQAKKDVRQAIAKMLNVTPQEIALTHHTTNGMNIVIHGLSWQPGDEIITTNLEHQGGLLPIYSASRRYGVIIKVVNLDVNDTPDEIVAKLEAAITKRTRLLAFSHVAWNTGQCLPMNEIVAMGHRHQVMSLVDGAQSAGAIPLDLAASKVEFYAIPGQKWLCGPEGIGALYIRQDCFSQVSPTFLGYLSLTEPSMYDLNGEFMLAPDARRYEVGTVYRPAIKAMANNLKWLAEEVGWDWIYAHITQMTNYTHTSLSELAGVTVITPPGSLSGLISFKLDGYEPPRVMMKLLEYNIVVRFVGNPYSLRVSVGFYTTKGDIDRLMAALAAILASAPDSLPEFVTPW